MHSKFVPSPAAAAAAPSAALRTLLASNQDRDKLLRLLESSLRWLIYLSRTPRQQKTTRTILITLISLSAIQRTLPLIPLTVTTTTTTHTTTTTTEPPAAQNQNQNQNQNQLRSTIESATNALEISVTLLDNLSLLRSPPKLLSTATNLANLALNILHYARSSLDKAALWHLGRSTRQALADTEQSIRHNKRLLRTTHDHPPQPPLLLEQIAADTRLNRARKASLKHSKHALHRLGWARIVYAIDALVSAYDLLELKYCSRGLRMLIESTSALLDFRAAYGHALQSLSPSTTPP
ncbi:hypothetical protein, variant [Puccinia triticina 1-1 BBBD Race 1]|uniref:Uncharacterized protein n=1 Tax=Puccinia triticina (isolate 1-1 / race 1 (BBBD)) TaxID=630390 RepID=A0A180GIK1_PUCT1|nr:hypothetical protein, variant [Puccinia triticina 1-1 BBBD Race 1]